MFITTSTLTQEAKEYVGNINSKIVLIDCQRLTALMVDHNVGVAPVGDVYEVKKIDADYFDGE